MSLTIQDADEGLSLASFGSLSSHRGLRSPPHHHHYHHHQRSVETSLLDSPELSKDGLHSRRSPSHPLSSKDESADSLARILRLRTSGSSIAEQRSGAPDAVVPTIFSRQTGGGSGGGGSKYGGVGGGRGLEGYEGHGEQEQERGGSDVKLGLGLGLSMSGSSSLDESYRAMMMEVAHENAGHHLSGLSYPTAATNAMGLMFGAVPPPGLPFHTPIMGPAPPHFLMPQPGISPGALARQQRATVDLQRGKRKRPHAEGSTSGGSGLGKASGGAGGGEGATSAAGGGGGGGQQEVPASVVKPTAGADGMPPSISKMKEDRRRKRLLRNRVSAQQARERKRQHMTELEERINRMESDNERLEEQIADLAKENEQLRQLVKENMRASAGVVAHTRE